MNTIAYLVSKQQFLNQGTPTYTPVNLKYPASGNYPSNDSQNWIFNLTTGDSFIIQVNAIDTETGFDFLKIYEGTDNTGTRIAYMHGNTPVSNFIAYSDIYIEFTSDSSTNALGFDLTITEASGNTNCGRIISYPNGSENYPKNDNNEWVISHPTTGELSITFSEFNFENNFDFLYVYDGINDSAPLLGALTGTSLPSTLTTTNGNGFFLRATSDSGVERPGFVAIINCA